MSKKNWGPLTLPRHGQTVLESANTVQPPQILPIQQLPLAPQLELQKASDSPMLMDLVSRSFRSQIQPIYGDQSSAIRKLQEGTDRECEVLLNNGTPVGVLVYKKYLQNEWGIKNALELKSLFLIHPELNSGNGFGTYLFNRVDDIAVEKQANSIFCTASSITHPSIKCALKNDYLIKNIVNEDVYGKTYLLEKRWS